MDAVQTCRAADAGRTGLGAAGALRASPRVHVDALRCSRCRRRGGSSRRRPEGDITLDGASEFDQVRISGPSREGEHGGSSAVDGDSAGHEIGKHSERHNQGLPPSVSQLREGRLGRSGAQRGSAGAELGGRGRRPERIPGALEGATKGAAGDVIVAAVRAESMSAATTGRVAASSRSRRGSTCWAAAGAPTSSAANSGNVVRMRARVMSPPLLPR